ncbi:hypothetical protein VNO77_21971 [Canavalia gladiata]|uniref:Uncharacterized protein n=1 Tax=Canavalia gladiata TaxID=3824 RepID=A0AAN9L6X3_CANGL
MHCIIVICELPSPAFNYRKRGLFGYLLFWESCRIILRSDDPMIFSVFLILFPQNIICCGVVLGSRGKLVKTMESVILHELDYRNTA